MPLPVYQFDSKYGVDVDGFTFELSAWLGDKDALAGTPTATIDPQDTVTIQDVILDGTQVTVWISGGTVGITYTIQIEGRTSRGRDCLIRGTFLVEP